MIGRTAEKEFTSVEAEGQDEASEAPKYVSAAEKAREWGLTVRRVRFLCAQYLVFRARRDRTTGEWRIPAKAERPIDRRAYRYRKVPPHLRDLIQHADVAVAKAKAAGKMTDEESWRFFCRGSAHHMHIVYQKSDLTFSDACEIEKGNPDGAPEGFFREMAIRHIKALNLLRTAARKKRRLSMTLVREVMKTIKLGRRPRIQSAMAGHELAAQLIRISHSKPHPIVKAGDVLERIYWLDPYPGYSPQLGYLMANFILMRSGYPPAILYRVIFATLDKYWEKHYEIVEDAADPRLLPPPPEKYRAFLCACLIRSVVRSCRLGIRPVTLKMCLP